MISAPSFLVKTLDEAVELATPSPPSIWKS